MMQFDSIASHGPHGNFPSHCCRLTFVHTGYGSNRPFVFVDGIAGMPPRSGWYPADGGDDQIELVSSHSL
jgi:hypothetical protein